jgi:hypothetical protein
MSTLPIYLIILLTLSLIGNALAIAHYFGEKAGDRALTAIFVFFFALIILPIIFVK